MMEVTKVWWDGNKIMAEPVDPASVYSDIVSDGGMDPRNTNPSRQCKWPTCQSEEYQQALAEQIKRELIGDQPKPQEPVTWGVDWGRAGQAPCATIIKRLHDGRIEVVAVEYGPERTWRGLTDDERRAVRNSVAYNQFMTAGEYAEHVQKATEAMLKERNK